MFLRVAQMTAGSAAPPIRTKPLDGALCEAQCPTGAVAAEDRSRWIFLRRAGPPQRFVQSREFGPMPLCSEHVSASPASVSLLRDQLRFVGVLPGVLSCFAILLPSAAGPKRFAPQVIPVQQIV